MIEVILKYRQRWIEHTTKTYWLTQILVLIIAFAFLFWHQTIVASSSYLLKYSNLKIFLICQFQWGIYIIDAINASHSRRYMRHKKFSWLSYHLTLLTCQTIPIIELVTLFNASSYEDQQIWVLVLCFILYVCSLYVSNIYLCNASLIYIDHNQLFVPISPERLQTTLQTIRYLCFISLVNSKPLNYIYAILLVLVQPTYQIFLDNFSNYLFTFLFGVLMIMFCSNNVPAAIIVGFIQIIRFHHVQIQLENTLICQQQFQNSLKTGCIGNTQLIHIRELLVTSLQTSTKLNGLDLLIQPFVYDADILNNNQLLLENFQYFDPLLFLYKLLSNLLPFKIKSKKQLEFQEQMQKMYSHFHFDRWLSSNSLLKSQNHTFFYSLYIKRYVKRINNRFDIVLKGILGTIYEHMSTTEAESETKTRIEKKMEQENLINQYTYDYNSCITMQRLLIAKRTDRLPYDMIYYMNSIKKTMVVQSQVFTTFTTFISDITQNPWIQLFSIILLDNDKKTGVKLLLKKRYGFSPGVAMPSFNLMKKISSFTMFKQLVCNVISGEIKFKSENQHKINANADAIYFPQTYWDFEQTIVIKNNNDQIQFDNQKYFTIQDVKSEFWKLQQFAEQVQKDIENGDKMMFDLTDDQKIYRILINQKNQLCFIDQKVYKEPNKMNNQKMNETSGQNTFNKDEEQISINIVGVSKQNLSFYNLTQALDLLNLNIYQPNNEENQQYSLHDIQINEYEDLSSYILGFWNAWNYNNVKQISNLIILYGLDQIYESFILTDKKFALYYKKNPNFDILCAHFALHDNFHFDVKQLKELKLKTKIYTKLTANNKRMKSLSHSRNSSNNSSQSNISKLSDVDDMISKKAQMLHLSISSYEEEGKEFKNKANLTQVLTSQFAAQIKYWFHKIFSSSKFVLLVLIVSYIGFITNYCAHGLLEWQTEQTDISQINNYITYITALQRITQYRGIAAGNSKYEYKQKIAELLSNITAFQRPDSIAMNYLDLTSQYYTQQPEVITKTRSLLGHNDNMFIDALTEVDHNIDDANQGFGSVVSTFKDNQLAQFLSNLRVIRQMMRKQFINVHSAIINYQWLVPTCIMIFSAFILLQYSKTLLKDMCLMINCVKEVQYSDIQNIIKYYQEKLRNTIKKGSVLIKSINSLSRESDQVLSKLPNFTETQSRVFSKNVATTDNNIIEKRSKYLTQCTKFEQKLRRNEIKKLVANKLQPKYVWSKISITNIVIKLFVIIVVVCTLASMNNTANQYLIQIKYTNNYQISAIARQQQYFQKYQKIVASIYAYYHDNEQLALKYLQKLLDVTSIDLQLFVLQSQLEIPQIQIPESNFKSIWSIFFSSNSYFSKLFNTDIYLNKVDLSNQNLPLVQYIQQLNVVINNFKTQSPIDTILINGIQISLNSLTYSYCQQSCSSSDFRVCFLQSDYFINIIKSIQTQIQIISDSAIQQSMQIDEMQNIAKIINILTLCLGIILFLVITYGVILLYFDIQFYLYVFCKKRTLIVIVMGIIVSLMYISIICNVWKYVLIDNTIKSLKENTKDTNNLKQFVNINSLQLYLEQKICSNQQSQIQAMIDKINYIDVSNIQIILPIYNSAYQKTQMQLVKALKSCLTNFNFQQYMELIQQQESLYGLQSIQQLRSQRTSYYAVNNNLFQFIQIIQLGFICPISLILATFIGMQFSWVQYWEYLNTKRNKLRSKIELQKSLKDLGQEKLTDSDHNTETVINYDYSDLFLRWRYYIYLLPQILMVVFTIHYTFKFKFIQTMNTNRVIHDFRQIDNYNEQLIIQFRDYNQNYTKYNKQLLLENSAILQYMIKRQVYGSSQLASRGDQWGYTNQAALVNNGIPRNIIMDIFEVDSAIVTPDINFNIIEDQSKTYGGVGMPPVLVLNYPDYNIIKNISKADLFLSFTNLENKIVQETVQSDDVLQIYLSIRELIIYWDISKTAQNTDWIFFTCYTIAFIITYTMTRKYGLEKYLRQRFHVLNQMVHQAR
ncbi:Hypothetical_protein [Hexamita inflata]|uniref:Hypothetical_protein n=1 Tax=Hexamita inflata TaxID=28002 RepID=A0AA86UX84_9EUKA|nr:Hypothetical protein HINF_LOCUS63180 [Hexamita inflata]